MLEYIHPDLRSLALPIDTLTEDPKNANKHGDRNLAAIAESFKRFGQRKPIVVRREGMVIEAGNGTLAALREAGWTHLACVVCDDDEQTAIAYGLADNQSSRLAEWDFDSLRANVETLLAADYDVAGLGWSGDDLADILAGKAGELADAVGPVNEPSPDAPPDNPSDSENEVIPDPPPEPITRPGDVVELGPHILHCADCMDVLRSLPDSSVDAIVTDPPYGLSPDGRARTWDEIEALRADGKGPKSGFMGREWDAGVPGITWARECLRVLKPGGHIVAFSATRTVHRLAVALEDAGFEIRDQIAWEQYQGFPKSLDVSKAIDKMHGAEREVIRVATRRGNAERRGAGEQGVTYGDCHGGFTTLSAPVTNDAKRWAGWGTALKPSIEPAILARKPLSEPTVAANVLKWGTGALNIDACRYAEGDPAWPGPSSGAWSASGHVGPWVAGGRSGTDGPPVRQSHDLGRWPANLYACPKPARSEREAGTDGLPAQDGHESAGRVEGSAGSKHARAGRTADGMRNYHPTVKPVRLFRWLLRLVTPPGGTVVEPFFGSGTTMVAAIGLDCRVIAAEREPAYCDIGRARVEHALGKLQ